MKLRGHRSSESQVDWVTSWDFTLSIMGGHWRALSRASKQEKRPEGLDMGTARWTLSWLSLQTEAWGPIHRAVLRQ